MGWRTMRLRLTYRTAKKLLSRMQSFCKLDYKQADKKKSLRGIKVYLSKCFLLYLMYALKLYKASIVRCSGERFIIWALILLHIS